MEVKEDLMEEEEMDMHMYNVEKHIHYLEDTIVEYENLNERLERSNKNLKDQLKEFNERRFLEVAEFKKNEGLINQETELSIENNKL